MNDKHRKHTAQRALERYGFVLSDYEYDRLCKKIIRGEAVPLKSMGHGCELFLVAHFHSLLPVLFYHPTGEIRTVYPESALMKVAARQRYFTRIEQYVKKGRVKEAVKHWREDEKKRKAKIAQQYGKRFKLMKEYA